MTSLTLVCLLMFAPGGTDEPAPLPVGLESEEATAAYREGVEQFERGEFDEARDSFRTAKRDADGDAKDRIEAYDKACRAAKKIPRIEKAIEREQWRKAYGELERVQRGLDPDTPLAVHLDPLRISIESQLFVWLATFEAEPPEPEIQTGRPDSATLNIEEEFVREGERSLRWSSGGRNGALAGMSFGRVPLAAFDGRIVHDYRILDLWIYSTDDNFGKFTLYFGIEEGGPAGGFSSTDILKTKCFLHHITIDKKGWQRIRVDLLKELPKNHELDWVDVTGVSLMTVPPSHPKTIYIDGLRLERP